MAIESYEGRAFIVSAGFHPGDPRRFPYSLHIADNISPGLTAIARDLHVAVVGSHPDQLAVLGRLGDGVNAGMHLGCGVINSHTTRFFLLLFLRIISAQIGRDAFPGLAMIAGP